LNCGIVSSALRKYITLSAVERYAATVAAAEVGRD
jgi:hypothetical protein